MTKSEALLWDALRGRRFNGLKFRRQARIGHRIVDFYCAEQRLVIEVDGGIHKRQRAEDGERRELLEKIGLRVLRIEASKVEDDLEAALALIGEACVDGPSPSLRERGGRLAGVRELPAAAFQDRAGL
jgi:very-short-patch-repair endonuclease